jgi:hypothetical protein
MRTCYAERLFSRAGLTITEKRNRINEDVAADLIFLNSNWDKFENLELGRVLTTNGESVGDVDLLLDYDIYAA